MPQRQRVPAPCTHRAQHTNSWRFCRIPLEVFLLQLHKSNQSNLGTGHTTAMQTARLAGTCSLLAAAGCYNNSRAAGSTSNSRTKAGKEGGQGQAVPQQPGTHGCVPGFALPDSAQICNAVGLGERRTERFQVTEKSDGGLTLQNVTSGLEEEKNVTAGQQLMLVHYLLEGEPGNTKALYVSLPHPGPAEPVPVALQVPDSTRQQ